MSDFKKTVTTARAKVAKAEFAAFRARGEALDAIMDGASAHDILLLATYILAEAAPDCCSEHLAEYRAELLRLFDANVAHIQAEREDTAEVEAESDDAAPPQVH